MLAFVNEKCVKPDVLGSLWDKLNANQIITQGDIPQIMNTGIVLTERDYVVFNLSSALNFGFYLTNLIPLMKVEDERMLDWDDEKSFDLTYAQYIMSTDAAFVDMFNIINTIYSGASAIIVFGTEGIKSTIRDSFMKFIQQRYGITARLINELEDWDSYTDIENFNLVGVYNLDIDKEKYTMLTTDFDELIRENQEEE